MIIPRHFNQKKYQKYLIELPKIKQYSKNIITIYNPKDFFNLLIDKISKAKKLIYLAILYLEKDQAGLKILKTIYQAKTNNPNLEVAILVDWYRAHRTVLGKKKDMTNSDWYSYMANKYKNIDVPIYGIPINLNEALGVLHLKGCIIDDYIFYSGASISNEYLNQFNTKYRYDRYQVIYNRTLSNSMSNLIRSKLLIEKSILINKISSYNKKKFFIRRYSRVLRKQLKSAKYFYNKDSCYDQLSIIPLLGVGKNNLLNRTIHNLVCSTKYKLTLCTPYFNLFPLLIKDISKILNLNKTVEIIVGDKISNDFYNPDNSVFKIISIIPYLYEINLRNFIKNYQNYIDNGNLIIKVWRHKNNSFHIKGIWVDRIWTLLTGNNFNARAWALDLENAILIHDPKQEIKNQRKQELSYIYKYTKRINSFQEIEKISDYPKKVKKIIRNIQIIHFDRLIKKIL
ncbi:MAG: CDP-diacylglycerol--serine O-phosphatidyltransferase [Wigglesworthia glossinidia]|nr:CDP-diacylglycerol--serine O-phosphatidyltransferase [Wigglesworthia glossinidia]